jgi:subtilase family protein
LFLISAGNVDAWEPSIDYRDVCDTAGIEDPAQAWNALTVGAHTDLTSIPSDPSFAHWTPLAAAGDLSPHSRTSVLFGPRPWPLKPDICMEGGNVLTDGTDFHDKRPLLTVRTTSHKDDRVSTSPSDGGTNTEDEVDGVPVVDDTEVIPAGPEARSAACRSSLAGVGTELPLFRRPHPARPGAARHRWPRPVTLGRMWWPMTMLHRIGVSAQGSRGEVGDEYLY